MSEAHTVQRLQEMINQNVAIKCGFNVMTQQSVEMSAHYVLAILQRDGFIQPASN